MAPADVAHQTGAHPLSKTARPSSMPFGEAEAKRYLIIRR